MRVVLGAQIVLALQTLVSRELPPRDPGEFFTTDPPIRSVYFSVGGTPKADIDAEEAGGPKVPSHHSPFFKVSPEPSIKTGVEATVLALLDLMKK